MLLICVLFLPTLSLCRSFPASIWFSDAFLGFKDLFTRHPHVLPLQFARVFTQVLHGIVDDEAPVRQALHTFLQFALPQITPEMVKPFIKLYMVW
jgi:hypothetical protein